MEDDCRKKEEEQADGSEKGHDEEGAERFPSILTNHVSFFRKGKEGETELLDEGDVCEVDVESGGSGESIYLLDATNVDMNGVQQYVRHSKIPNVAALDAIRHS